MAPGGTDCGRRCGLRAVPVGRVPREDVSDCGHRDVNEEQAQQSVDDVGGEGCSDQGGGCGDGIVGGEGSGGPFSGGGVVPAASGPRAWRCSCLDAPLLLPPSSSFPSRHPYVGRGFRPCLRAPPLSARLVSCWLSSTSALSSSACPPPYRWCGWRSSAAQCVTRFHFGFIAFENCSQGVSLLVVAAAISAAISAVAVGASRKGAFHECSQIHYAVISRARPAAVAMPLLLLPL